MKKKNTFLRVGLVLTALVVGFIVLGLFWTPYSPNAMDFSRLLPPSAAHPMGTDKFGQVRALCQKRIVYRKDIHPGFWAKLLCRFVHVTPAGPGAGTPHKMQLIIMICGLPRVLLAAFCSAVTKLFGKKGVFYKVCGHEVDGIDGLIDYDISFKEYVDYGILNPENPSGVCDEIYEKTGVKAMIIDASDIDCVILGKCRNVTLTDEQLCEIVRDNPAGQEGQCTPFILIRKKA